MAASVSQTQQTLSPESFDVYYLELSKEIKAEVKSERWEYSVFSKSRSARKGIRKSIMCKKVPPKFFFANCTFKVKKCLSYKKLQ